MVVARATVRDGAKIPAIFDEGDRVSVEVRGERLGRVRHLGRGHRTQRYAMKDVTVRGDVVTEIREDGGIVDVTGDGRASMTLTLSQKTSAGGKT